MGPCKTNLTGRLQAVQDRHGSWRRQAMLSPGAMGGNPRPNRAFAWRPPELGTLLAYGADGQTSL